MLGVANGVGVAVDVVVDVAARIVAKAMILDLVNVIGGVDAVAIVVAIVCYRCPLPLL